MFRNIAPQHVASPRRPSLSSRSWGIKSETPPSGIYSLSGVLYSPRSHVAERNSGKTCNNLGTPSVTGCFLAEMRETWAKTNFVVAFSLAMGAWLWFLGWLMMRLLHAIGS